MLRQELEIFLRQNFITKLVDVPARAKNIFVIMRRVESVVYIDKRYVIVIRPHVENINKNNVARCRLNFI